MVQIPDNIKPHVDLVVKYHFWLLAPLVPLVVVPLVFMTNGSLGEQINSARSQIESRLSSLKSVAGIEPHPNEAWSTDIDARTNAVRRETLAEWQRFWNSQQPLRVWPDSLGVDFVQRAAVLKADGKLPRKLLERYQNNVRAIVRQLPARMGADEAMIDAAADAAAQPGRVDPAANRGMPGQPVRSNKLVQWNAEDQKRVYASFDWAKPPSTLQVLLAQEELWVYGLLCDSIARVNKVAAGPYNSPIPLVEQLAIGYPAAEDDPGASRGGRIIMPTGQAVGGMPLGEEAMAPPSPDGMGAASRPPHPRFGGGGQGPGPGFAAPVAPPPEEGGAAAAVSPDEALKNWIYVDFNGKPLSAAELATAPDAVMVHLMPFVMRVVIDERQLDGWLVDLARAPVPIDVRQVRINAGATGSQPMAGPADPGFNAAGPNPVATTGRRHDIVVELRGTVGLATPPDEKVLGLEPTAVVEPTAGAEPSPAAAEPAPAEEAAPAAEPAPAAAAPEDNPVPAEPVPQAEPAPAAALRGPAPYRPEAVA